MIDKVLNSKQGLGYDVNQPYGDPIDVMEIGIVDPTRVIREAIQNAVSVAGTAMTMGALVTDVPEKNPPATPAMGSGMDMM